MNKTNKYCGIMQPYFFPYWGHFSLIAYTSKWIIFDECQYKPKSWMNRNRILHPSLGWQYLTVPLKNSSRNIKAKDAKIINPSETRLIMIRKLEHYKKEASNFSTVTDLIDEVFKHVDSEYSLTSLCHASIRLTCEYLGISFNTKRSSELKLCYPTNMSAGSWAPFIAESVNATGYLNPISGAPLFDISEFKKRNLKLKFLRTKPVNYSQGNYEKHMNLSILDTLMWLPPDEIRHLIIENVCIIDGGQYLQKFLDKQN